MIRIEYFFVAAALLFTNQGITHAALIINISESGADVIADGNGQLDLTDATFRGFLLGQSRIWADQAIIKIGTGSHNRFLIAQGPSSFGPGPGLLEFQSPFFSGDLIGIRGAGDGGSELLVPADYVNGTPLSGTATFENRSIAGLGMTSGTYLYQWGSGATADTLTVNIAATSVPEPSSLALVGTACAAACLIRRRRREI